MVCLSAALIMVGALFLGAEKVAEVPLIPPPFDKVVHFGYFLTMSLFAFTRVGARLWWTAIPFLIAVGALDELHQLSVPGRDGSVGDFVADAIGVVVAAMIFRGAGVSILARKATSDQRPENP